VEFLLLILLTVNLLATIYLYLRLKDFQKDGMRDELFSFTARVEERLRDLQEIKRDLSKIYITEELGRAISDEVRKISAVLLGRRSGQAGERVVEEILSFFPSKMIARNVKLSNGIVEFALRLRGEKYIPIDSKLSSPEILAKPELSPEDEKEILRRIKDRAKEITAYLKDERSAGLALMVIPDGLYNFLKLRIFSELEKENIIPVPYQALPQVLMMIILLWERFFFTFDREKFKEVLPILEKNLALFQKDLEQTKTELKSASNLLDRVRGTLTFLQRYLSNLKEVD